MYSPRLKSILRVSMLSFATFLLLAGLAGAASLWGGTPKFGNPIEDVYTARQPISGAAWINTGDGVVVIDTLTTSDSAVLMAKEIKKQGNGKIKYIIYTHGHPDHTAGAAAFMADRPEVIANSFLPARLDKYNYQAEHRARITGMQFNVNVVPHKRNWVYPTKTFQGKMTFKLGNKTFELHTARGETDDVAWVWVPELKAVFIGDMIIGSFPNIGNPYKPTRYALDWAENLAAIRAKNPEHVFYNGAGNHMQGEYALGVLDDNIAAIRSLFDQVIDLINKDVHITEMIHRVSLPDHLKKKPHLRFGYSNKEFFVFNTYRWYHGYYDGNPANLLPRPQKEVRTVLMSLIGDPKKVLDSAAELLKSDRAQLGLEVLDVLIQADPNNTDARRLRIELLEDIIPRCTDLMSRNTYTTFIAREKVFLSESGIVGDE